MSSSRLGVRTVSRLVLRAMTPEDAALAPDGDGLDPDRDLLAPLRVALAHDPALVQGGVQQRAAAARDEMADHVVLVGGGAGVGAHLGHGDVAGAVAGGDPQDQVGEGEVGEQLPLRDQQMQPLEVGVVECGVLAYEFVHGGHVCERTWGYARGGKHPRAAAPERDPQPSRHRSPEQYRPRGVRSRRPKVRSRGSQGREPGSSVRLPVRGRRRLSVLPAVSLAPRHCGLDH